MAYPKRSTYFGYLTTILRTSWYHYAFIYADNLDKAYFYFLIVNSNRLLWIIGLWLFTVIVYLFNHD